MAVNLDWRPATPHWTGGRSRSPALTLRGAIRRSSGSYRYGPRRSRGDAGTPDHRLRGWTHPL